jgi:hypothetical protein
MQSINAIIVAIIKKRYNIFGSQIAYASRDWMCVLLLMLTILVAGAWYIFSSIMFYPEYTQKDDILNESFYDVSTVAEVVLRIQQEQEEFTVNYHLSTNNELIVPVAETSESNPN